MYTKNVRTRIGLREHFEICEFRRAIRLRMALHSPGSDADCGCEIRVSILDGEG
jgi:hypothetical protein